MRRADLMSGIVLSIFGLAAIFIIIPWQIDPGDPGYVSPRLMPTLMMVFITLLSLLLVFRSLPSRSAPHEEIAETFFTGSELLAIVKIAGVFALSILLYLLVSPLAAGITLVAGTLIALGERRLWMIAAMPIGLLGAIWVLFYKVLGTAIV